MNRHFLSAALIILVFLWRDDVLRYLHVIEDSLLPVDPLDFGFLDELVDTEHGLILRGSDPAYSNCSTWELSINETIGYGWSKSVHSLSAATVIKRPYLDGRTFQNCFHTNFGKEDWELRCHMEILRGFINEIKMLLLLRDNYNVIKLISYCIPRNPWKNLENVNIITERGTPVDLFLLLQLSLSQRDHLFKALHSFFVGNPTLRLHDFRRQQLVMVDDQPKIVDFDEAYFIDADSESDHYQSIIKQKLIAELLVNYTDTGLQHDC
ncbi:hypothetical protein ANCCAN_01740 [Ancylostoma caninum]|uniref:Protein kinase domain-containing protein n=1 Tax=Ancylostoma caninum TaxID=29170 RepID=A0A368H5S6_ANCCA|nr:hypothetical protein ANCCAN_01740 [Ancylostoma caninum]